LSKRILSSYQNDLSRLSKLSVKELSKFKGIGEAKAIAIIAALELGRRRKETIEEAPQVVKSSKDAFLALSSVFSDLPHEEFWVLLLNRANFIMSKQFISKGGQAGTVVDPKIIFKVALEHNAASLIVAHNHPSGNLKPSEADITLTKKLKQAGLMLDLPVYDHLIITDNGFLSMADEGLM
jgi:DNA repair protein RadC